MKLINKIQNKYRALDDQVAKEWLENPKTRAYVSRVDKLGNITYSLVVGASLDYFKSGIETLRGIASARSSGTLANLTLAGIYGQWKDYCYKKTNTTTDSSWFKKKAVDFFVFNTFQTPQYGLSAIIGNLVQDQTMNLPEVWEGMKFLGIWSPIIAPTMNKAMDLTRLVFGIPSSAKLTELKKIAEDNYIEK